MRISRAIVGAGHIDDSIVTGNLNWNDQPCEGVSITERIRQESQCKTEPRQKIFQS